MTDQPADLLTAAAQRLREAADAIDTTDPTGQPWHTEPCTDGCPCIVAQGHDQDGRARYYVADAETPQIAAYLLLTQPAVGRAIANLLDHEAAYQRHLSETGQDGAEDSEHVLHVARAVLGQPTE